MAAHPAEHAQRDATLRPMALGTLILNAFSVRAALGRFIRCRCSAIQNNVQTNTYDPRRPGATSSLLSCRQSQTLVGALILAVVMSGVVDNGRKSGHGNADANDPTRTWLGTREFGSRAAIGASEPTGVDRVIDHSIKPRAAQSMNKVLFVRLPGRSGMKNAKHPV